MNKTFEILDKISREIGFRDFQDVRIRGGIADLVMVIEKATKPLLEELNAPQS